MGFSSAEALWESREAGALWENHVLNQWIRQKNWHEPSLGIWYWRDQSGNEVDIVLEKDRKLHAVECKIKEKPDKKDLQGIKHFKAFYGSKEVAKSYLACPTDLPYDLEPGTIVVSGWTTWHL